MNESTIFSKMSNTLNILILFKNVYFVKIWNHGEVEEAGGWWGCGGPAGGDWRGDAEYVGGRGGRQRGCRTN